MWCPCQFECAAHVEKEATIMDVTQALISVRLQLRDLTISMAVVCVTRFHLHCIKHLYSEAIIMDLTEKDVLNLIQFNFG